MPSEIDRHADLAKVLELTESISSLWETNPTSRQSRLSAYGGGGGRGKNGGASPPADTVD